MWETSCMHVSILQVWCTNLMHIACNVAVHTKVYHNDLTIFIHAHEYASCVCVSVNTHKHLVTVTRRIPLIRCNTLPHPRFLNKHLATVTRKIPLIRCSALLHPRFLTGQMRMTKYWGCGMNLWYLHMRAHTHTNTHTHGHTTTHTGSHSWIWTHTCLSLRKLFSPVQKLCFPPSGKRLLSFDIQMTFENVFFYRSCSSMRRLYCLKILRFV